MNPGLTHSGYEQGPLPVAVQEEFPCEKTPLGTPQESNVDYAFDSVDLESPCDITPLETSENSDEDKTTPSVVEDGSQCERTTSETPEESDGYETPPEMEIEKHQLIKGDSPTPEDTNDTQKKRRGTIISQRAWGTRNPRKPGTP